MARHGIYGRTDDFFEVCNITHGVKNALLSCFVVALLIHAKRHAGVCNFLTLHTVTGEQQYLTQ